MLTIANKTISEKEIDLFLEDLYTQHIVKESKYDVEIISATLRTAAEKADWIIDTILGVTIQSINDGWLKDWFRSYLLSIKFGIQLRHSQGNSPQYVLERANDECALVSSPHRNPKGIEASSTIVLSPIGEIKIPEGQVWINPSVNAYGYTSKWNGLFGLFTWYGDMLFPCVFDYLTNPLLNELWGTLLYKGFLYRYIMKGKREDMNNVDIERITTENLSSMAFICDDRVYLIEFMGYNTFDYMHKGGIAAFREDAESFNKLSDGEKMELAAKNIEEFFEIIQSIHQDTFPNRVEEITIKPTRLWKKNKKAKTT